MSKKFVISGRRKLSGEYRVQGNKNAALPLLSGSLLSQSTTHFHNVPRIVDVEYLVELLEALGVQVSWHNGTLSVDSGNLRGGELPAHLVEKLRGSILLLGSLAPLFNHVACDLPGGCPIGRRSFDVHWDVFRSAGFSVDESAGRIELKKIRNVKMPKVYLEESSVTATENALILFSALGQGIVENPAREPHVLSLVEFLRQLGCEIELHPLYYRVRRGVAANKREMDFQVPGDYIDAGTVAIAAAVTRGQVELHGITREEFSPIQNILERFGLQFEETSGRTLRVSASDLANSSKVTAGLWPSFPTDLVSLAIVLSTQGKGLCLIQDWMYEGRMFFIDKLVRMGAHITMCDPHRVLVEGPTLLRGTHLESPDIRAGMALVVAGLCADGVTTIEHAEVIQRGYENVAQRLAAIGAEISEIS
ncbi:UDP-N-acetylglucosamine 1-carboxyvinyltransferase [Acidobacteria bacterium AH-259-L09]|nr:UDP-N-acetylglucosamine 1-carboxyvinyltransferase [Acidobacteria bacterium AH-259-L09]